MACFANEAELETFLVKLDPDYGQYASAVWQNGVRTANELANADKEDPVAAGVTSAIHAQDIKARAGPQVPDFQRFVDAAVSEEIRYMHIAQSAITDLTLVSDPHLLENFAPMSSINGCPEDFATIDSSAKENDVHISRLHQALAKGLGATVGDVNCCSTFEVNSRNVVISHNIETMGHLKPDIVVVDNRLLPGALSLLTFVEVLTGSMEDAAHVGKMIVYLRQLLRRHPCRTHVYGALTNLQTTAVYHCARARDTVHRSPAVSMGQGGFSLLINLLQAPSDVLGYATPNLNLSSLYSPVRVLGQGRNSTVYEAIANAEHFAVKVFDFSKQGAEKAFQREKAVLEALMASQKNEAEGAKTLPRLITTSTNIIGVSAASIVTQPVASPISAGKLDEVFLKGYLAGLRCLHGLHYVHGDIEPRHLCISASGSPAIIDLGTVRYAATDILSTLSAPVGELGEMELQREAKHDLVALVKSFWAIRFGKVEQLNAIEAWDIQAIEKFWADVLDDTIVAKNYNQAMSHAAISDCEGVCSALGNVCVPLDKKN